MTRYIDAELIPYVESENGFLDDFAYRYDINEIPTADVVPKSEVERLEKEVDRLSQVVLYHDSFKIDEINDARQEVAREIFAEIEAKAPWFCENQTAYEHFNEELAELKKKYTEVE